jgi:hypothetical protein
MKKESQPFIHMFETHGGRYLYDVNMMNSIIDISEELYNALMNKDMEHNEVKALTVFG